MTIAKSEEKILVQFFITKTLRRKIRVAAAQMDVSRNDYVEAVLREATKNIE